MKNLLKSFYRVNDVLNANTTYRNLLDELIEMPHIRRVLRLADLPTPSTLCKAFNWLDMAVWRVILTLLVRATLDE